VNAFCISPAHEVLVERLIQSLGTFAFGEIRVDRCGMPRPETIFGSRPHATARKDCEYIFDVVTDRTVNAAHCAVRWGDFATYARRHGAQFYVVAPRSAAAIARLRLAALEIEAQVLGV
jgi:hypothetical protein